MCVGRRRSAESPVAASGMGTSVVQPSPGIDVGPDVLVGVSTVSDANVQTAHGRHRARQGPQRASTCKAAKPWAWRDTFLEPKRSERGGSDVVGRHRDSAVGAHREVPVCARRILKRRSVVHGVRTGFLCGGHAPTVASRGARKPSPHVLGHAVFQDPGSPSLVRRRSNPQGAQGVGTWQRRCCRVLDASAALRRGARSMDTLFDHLRR